MDIADIMRKGEDNDTNNTASKDNDTNNTAIPIAYSNTQIIEGGHELLHVRKSKAHSQKC